jgi:GR25 family glycosyltransferase involved in LPS biosynthesis
MVLMQEILTSDSQNLKKNLIINNLLKNPEKFFDIKRSYAAIADASLAFLTDTKIFQSNFTKIKSSVEKLNFEIFAITLGTDHRLKSFTNHYNFYRNFDFYYGVNGHDPSFSPSDFEYFENKKHNAGEGGPGAMACALSHINLYKKLLNSSKDFYVIFEDDAIMFDYSDKLLQVLISSINLDMDLIHINGRAASYVYLNAYFDGSDFCGVTDSLLLSKSDLDKFIIKNIEKMPKHTGKFRHKHKDAPYVLSGMDAYIITRKGAKKILEFLHSDDYKKRCYRLRIDDLILRLSASKKDNLVKGFVYETPYLDSYVSKYPVAEHGQKISMNLRSDIHFFNKA